MVTYGAPLPPILHNGPCPQCGGNMGLRSEPDRIGQLVEERYCTICFWMPTLPPPILKYGPPGSHHPPRAV